MERTSKKVEYKDIEARVCILITSTIILKYKLQEWEDNFSELHKHYVHIKMGGGVKIKHLICRRNPWENRDCKRSEWLICLEGKHDERQLGKCKTDGIIYNITCVNSRSNDVRCNYVAIVGG